jgi:hypothetical protein
MMGYRTLLREPLVGCNQQALIPLTHLPQGVILHPLIWGTTNITDGMAHHTQCLDRHEEDMLIHENLHVSPWGVLTASAA